MQKYISSLLLFSALWSIAFAGNDNLPLGARSAALGGASATLSDLWSAQNNQAGLAQLDTIEVGVYATRNFLLPQLAYNAFAGALPIKGGTFGLSYSRFGYSKYNENKVGIAFAKKLGDHISAAVQLNYLSKFIGDGYGKNGTIAAEFGIQAKLVKGLSVGAHVFNPTRAKSADYNKEKIPTIIKVGAQYAFSDKVFWAIESEKDIDYKPNFKTGIEYRVVPQLYIRGGISTQPTLSSFGFGLVLKNFKLDVAANYHEQLGFTPHLGLSYGFK
ncbi:MAG: hypothetical protein IPP32_08070 [Bacteroidetes bacterium]|nr:hypothetical protein [Bacteroidota bacterium]